MQHSRWFNVHKTSIPGSKCLRHENYWEPSDRDTQWRQDKLRLACVYRCEHTQRSKQSHDSTYRWSCRNILVVYLHSQHTDVVLLVLSWERQASQHFFRVPNCACCTGWICKRSRRVHWSGLGLWRVLVHTIVSWMALHCPCEKRLVVPFKLLRHEQGLNKLPRTHGAWLEHTREHMCRRKFDHRM